ncbi:MAG: hypothetical protein U0822_08570 [Anaerolineae bacterium]
MTALKYALVIALALTFASLLRSQYVRAHASAEPAPCSFTTTDGPVYDGCTFQEARLTPAEESSVATPTTVGTSHPVPNDFIPTTTSSALGVTPVRDGVMMIHSAIDAG